MSEFKKVKASDVKKGDIIRTPHGREKEVGYVRETNGKISILTVDGWSRSLDSEAEIEVKQ